MSNSLPHYKKVEGYGTIDQEFFNNLFAKKPKPEVLHTIECRIASDGPYTSPRCICQ